MLLTVCPDGNDGPDRMRSEESVGAAAARARARPAEAADEVTEAESVETGDVSVERRG